MPIKWKKNKNLKPEIILSKIDSIKKVSPENKVTYLGFDYHETIAVLVNMIDFPSQCDGLHQENIVSRAVNNIAKDNELEDKKVINEINNIVKSELATKEQKYHLLTSISLQPPFPLKNGLVEEVRIRILSKDYPKKYSGRNELLNKHSDIKETPSNYAKVIVSLKEKSAKGAATKALRALDIQRSFWCLFGNYSMEIIGDQWKPINRIRLGRFHTIHKDSGRVTNNNFWYEPNFSSLNLFSPKEPKVFTKNSNWAMSKLADIPYSTTLKEALLRYVRALDEKDQNVALIRLWSALEVLTAPSETNYDLVTRRCSFLFQDNTYHKQVLEHLREYRNANVHAGDQNERAKSSCYQLQFYFYNLVLFHIRNQGEFSTLDEANSFLDLPPTKEALKNRKRLIEKAISFVS
jgi:hypothetical protein